MIGQILSKAASNLIAYRQRSLMTILGIMWGIAAFILLIAYGNGFERAMNLGLSYFGDYVVVVWNGQTSLQAGGSKAGRRIRTTPDDVTTLRERATLVKRASPEVFNRLQLRWGDRIATAGIRAVNDQYGVIRGMFIEEGRFLNSEDLAGMKRVIVLGHDLKEKLFSQSPAVGEDVVLMGIRFTVIGVLKKKIAISSYFNPDDLCAMIPINVMGILRDIQYNSVLVFQPVSGALETQAIKQVRSHPGGDSQIQPYRRKSARHAALQLCLRDHQRHHDGDERPSDRGWVLHSGRRRSRHHEHHAVLR